MVIDEWIVFEVWRCLADSCCWQGLVSKKATLFWQPLTALPVFSTTTIKPVVKSKHLQLKGIFPTHKNETAKLSLQLQEQHDPPPVSIPNSLFTRQPRLLLSSHNNNTSE